MAARSTDRVAHGSAAQGFVTATFGAVEAVSLGVLRLTERTVIETVRAAEDIGATLGSAVASAARGSIKAAGDIGGDVAEVGRGIASWWPGAPATRGARKPPAKASQRQRRRRAA